MERLKGHFREIQVVTIYLTRLKRFKFYIIIIIILFTVIIIIVITVVRF